MLVPASCLYHFRSSPNQFRLFYLVDCDHVSIVVISVGLDLVGVSLPTSEDSIISQNQRVLKSQCNIIYFLQSFFLTRSFSWRNFYALHFPEATLIGDAVSCPSLAEIVFP